MQAEQDKTYTIGDEELAIVANALWTDGVHVEFEDIQTACRRYPGDLTTVTAKLREWVRQGKPTGTFCELSEEEHFRSVVEACDARPESWELALRVTKKFPQVPLGVTVNIALLIDGLDVIPQEDCDMIPFLSQLTMRKLSEILQLLRVPKPKGNKQVWLEVVAGLCAQSSIIRKTRAAQADVEEANKGSIRGKSRAAKKVAVAAAPDRDGAGRLKRRALGKKDATGRCHKGRKTMSLMRLGHMLRWAGSMRAAVSILASIRRRK